MVLRYTLTDPNGATKVVNDPAGWQKAVIGFSRHPKLHSLVEFFKSSFQSYGANFNQDGGREWLLAREKTFGCDAEINFLAEIDYNENGNWATLFNSVLNIQLFIHAIDSNNFLEIVPAQLDFWTQFINRFESEIDIQSNQNITEAAQGLAGTIAPVKNINLPLPVQIIDRKYQSFLKFNQAINFSPAGITNGTIYFTDLIVDFDTIILDEVDKTFQYGLQPINASNVTTPIVPFAKFIVAEDGDMSIDDFSVTMSTPVNDTPDHINGTENRLASTIGIFDVIIQVNDRVVATIHGVDDNRPVNYIRNDGKAITLFTHVVTDYTYSGVLKNLKRNDQVRIYAKLVNVANFDFYDVTGTNIHTRALFVWGSQGWDKNNFCFLIGGETFIPYGFTDAYVETKFSSLISDTYDPSSDARRNLITNLPAFEDNAYTLTTILNDTFIVAVPGTVGSGIFTQNVDIGDVIQMSKDTGSAGTITCVAGSPNIVGVGTNFVPLKPGDIIFIATFVGVTRDPTYFIGQVLSVTNATNLVLAANATVSYAGKVWGVKSFWVSKLSLYQGLEAYGRTHLNVTFHSAPGDVGNILNKGVTSSANNFLISDNSILSYQKGLTIYIQFDNSNTGAVTVNLNAFGAKDVKHLDGTALIANDIISQLVTTGTNVYALVAYASLITIVEGLQLVVKFVNANTGPSTLNVNGLGAIPIVNKYGLAVATGDILAGSIQSLIYNGTNFVLQDSNSTVLGQVYVLDYNGTYFVLTPISSSTGIAPTANLTTQAFLVHDVLAGVLDRITDYTNLFYSEYLGNQFTSRIYAALGKASLLTLMKGLHLRGYRLSEKSFFTSARDWFDGLNPIIPIGIGYDTVAGNTVVRCESQEYFYDDSSFSILFSNVQKIKRRYDNESQFSSVEIGYQKWESQAASGIGSPSGIDDPQSQRTFNSLFKNIGSKLSLMSGWVAAGLTIETIRRVGRLFSSNYAYDNDTIVISVKSNGDGTFTPELNENFSTIDNLSNSTTRYNSWLTATRNFLRWLNFLSGCLQDYLSSNWHFASGKGNYDMQSEMTDNRPGSDPGVVVNENGNVPISNTPLHLAMLYDIEHEMDWNDYVILRANRHRAIGLSQTSSGHVAFFIKDLDYEFASGTVMATGWTKVFLDLVVVDSPQPGESARYYESEYDPAYE